MNYSADIILQYTSDLLYLNSCIRYLLVTVLTFFKTFSLTASLSSEQVENINPGGGGGTED